MEIGLDLVHKVSANNTLRAQKTALVGDSSLIGDELQARKRPGADSLIKNPGDMFYPTDNLARFQKCSSLIRSSKYAIDWDMPVGDAVRAARDGVVVSTYRLSAQSGEATPCLPWGAKALKTFDVKFKTRSGSRTLVSGQKYLHP